MSDNTPTRELWCVMHNAPDTNGDGLCIRYATAARAFRDDWFPCLMLVTKVIDDD